MYHLRFLTAFVCLLSFSFVNAQEKCDTLILHPGRPLEVTVDSVANSKVYCKLCGKQPGQAQVIPLKMVAEIKYHDASKRSAQKDTTTHIPIEEVQETAHSEIKETKVPEWILTKKDKKSVQKRFKKGIKLKVVYLDQDRKQRLVAILDEITATHLVLESHYDSRVSIPREKVLKIKIKNGLGIFGGVALGVGLIVGLVAASIALIAITISIIFSGGQAPNASGLQEEANQGCTLSIVAIVIGIVALIASNASWINAPFSEKWEVEKVMPEAKQETNPNETEVIGIEQP